MLITKKSAYKIGLGNTTIDELSQMEKEFSSQLKKWRQGEIIE